MTNRDIHLKKLSELDFFATDLGLYLNTHPTDVEMIKRYNEIIQQADQCRNEFEKMYGPLTFARSTSSDEYFDWIKEPWPWMN